MKNLTGTKHTSLLRLIHWNK